jgi:hypothetical protein
MTLALACVVNYDHTLMLKILASLRIVTLIKVSRKDMSGTNTLAYYEHLEIMAVKGLLTLGPGSNVIKLFMFVIYKLSQ